MNAVPIPASGNPITLASVRIRMFRQGLGDCFLLTFTNAAQEQYNLMIDCGVLPISGGDKRLENSVKQTLGDHHNAIDAVVATHEHADHISGFTARAFSLASAGQPPQPAKIGQVWLAWTENPADEQVKQVVKKANALALAANAAALGLNEEQGRPIRDLLLFSGYSSEPGEPLGAQAKQKKAKFELNQNLANIMEFLRKLSPELKYLEQKDMIELAGFGVRIYPLGPSREIEMLGGQPPAPGQGLRLNRSTAFMAAAAKYAGLALAEAPQSGVSQGDLDDLFDQSLPFNPSKSLRLDEIKGKTPLGDAEKYRDFFKQVYGYGSEKDGHGPEWRRVDTDWLLMGSSLALQQVSIVNNTSLVLAIELTESRKVLLFAADAEEENWQTWKNEHADLKDLLARTVVYKTGHHGSVNGTDPQVLKNALTNPELVAIVPADVARAAVKKWKFPDPSLYDLSATSDAARGLLFQQTGGRILLNCIDECTDCPPDFNPTKPWPGKIEEDSSDAKMWVDYTLTF